MKIRGNVYVYVYISVIIMLIYLLLLISTNKYNISNNHITLII